MPTFNPTTTGRTGTIQTWVVPTTGPYLIQAHGARGGAGEDGDYGNGAYIEAQFNLTAGHTISILVGQIGGEADNGSNYGGGGGGATFVVNTTTSTPLLVAAGGNGGNWTSHTAVVAGGQWTPFNSTQQARPTEGRGGGGGTYSINGSNYSPTDGGASFTNGGLGGVGTYNNGGFGGGGGSQFEGGGGGGWVSGAPSGQNAYTDPGDSAYSYSAGSNTTGTNATRNTGGLAVITLLNQPPTVSIPSQASTLSTSNAVVYWNYSDTDNDVQTQYEISYRAFGGTWVSSTVSSSNKFHKFPAGIFLTDTVYEWNVKVSDGVDWSEYSAIQSFTAKDTLQDFSAPGKDIINLAPGSPTVALGASTVTNGYVHTDSKTYIRVQPTTSGHGARQYVDLDKLVDGQGYSATALIVNKGAASVTVTLDWCDVSGASVTLAAGAAGVVKLGPVIRSTYNSTYRFLDFTAPSGSDFLIRDVVITPGSPQPFFNGDSTDTPIYTYSWLTSGIALKKENYESQQINKVPNPVPTSAANYSGNGTITYNATEKAIQYVTPGVGSTSSFLPGGGVDQLYPAVEGDTVEARFLYKGSGGRAAIWHVCDAAGAIIQQVVTTLPASPSAYTEVVNAGTCIAGTASVRFVQLFYGSQAQGDGTHYFKNVIVHEPNRSGPYFDGATPDDTQYQYDWVGTANASASIKRPVKRHVVKNLLEGERETIGYGGGTSGWNWSSATIASGGYLGGRFLRSTATAATQTAGVYLYNVWGVVSGEKYTATYRGRPSAAGTTWNMWLEWRDDAGTMISGSTVTSGSLPANVWTEVGGIVTAPVGATNVTFCMYKNSGNLPSGGTMDYDVPFLAISPSGTAISHFDGNTADTATHLYSWSGEKDESFAIKETLYATGWTTLSEVVSSAKTGTINAAALPPGEYEIRVKTSDSMGYGDWSEAKTVLLAPATNIKVRVGGSFVDGVNMVKVGGVWIQAPPTEYKSGGSF